jgi:hypothetical protein
MRARFRSCILELVRNKHSHTLLSAFSREAEIGAGPTILNGSNRHSSRCAMTKIRKRSDIRTLAHVARPVSPYYHGNNPAIVSN